MTSDPQPVFWNCPAPCGVRYRVGSETTIRGYHRQPWFSHFQVDCPQCKETYFSFQSPDTLLNAMLTQVEDDRCTIEFADYAPDNIVRQYAHENDLPAITVDWQPKDDRSVRHRTRDERLVEFFHYLLERGDDS